MNRGTLSGIRGRVRQGMSYEGIGRSGGLRLGPLVYHPCYSPPGAARAYDIIGAPTSLTADQTWTWTPPLNGKGGVPDDGSCVGLHVMALARTSASAQNYLSIGDGTNDDLKIGVSIGGNAHELYFGQVAGVLTALNVDLVYTAGDSNTQFKYGVQWTTGTISCYLRLIGYWTEAR